MAFKLDNIPGTTAKAKTGNGIDRLLKKEITLFGKSFTNKKKQAFYLELSVLLKAGITIKEALTLIGESFKKRTDRETLEHLLEQVIGGKPFSEALLDSGHFSEYEYYSLKIGEATGTTARICHELGVFFERKNEQRRIIIAALTYPSIVFSTAILVVVFMLTYVVPMFEDIFRQNSLELPTLTRLIMQASAFVTSYGLLFLVFSVILFVAGNLFKNNPAFKRARHYLLLKIPVIGPFISKIYLAQFTQAVALLTASKVPLLSSIQMVGRMIHFVPLQDELAGIEQEIIKGSSFSKSLQGSRIFNNRIISLVKVAEETNQTEYVFNQLNNQYSQEVMQQSKVMSTVLEPVIILFVGGIVAVLLIAMYLPMFQLSSAIG